MLPALNHRPCPVNTLDQLKGQIDYTSRHIEEEKRERIRMREQLSIQNEIINKLYARLNQLEEEQAESNKVVSNILQSSLLQQQLDTRNQAKLEKLSDIEEVRRNFRRFSMSFKEETDRIRNLSNENHSSLVNIQDYLKALHQTDQSHGNRMNTLETNTVAAMECIKSLQNNTNRVTNRLGNLETMTSSREQEVTASLQEVANCIGQAKSERSQLQQMVHDSMVDLTKVKQSIDEKVQKSRVDMEKQREHRDVLISQSLEELAECYRNVDKQISEEVAGSFQDTKTLITALQASIVKEKSVRLEWEQKLRRDTANVLGNIRQNLREQMSQYIAVYEENKIKVDDSIKQLNHSIGLIEQSGETNKNGLEHILQAEIKSRTKGFIELEESLNTVRTALGALDNRREEDLKRESMALKKAFRRLALRDVNQVFHPTIITNPRATDTDDFINKIFDDTTTKDNVTAAAKDDITAATTDDIEDMDWEESVVGEDPNLCREYCTEVFTNETLKREPKWVMLERCRKRQLCVDWLTEIAHLWSLTEDTLFIACLYFDKVLRAGIWSVDDMEVIAATCLFIAAKVEEVQAIPIDDIAAVCPEASLDTIKHFEERILSLLQYEMTVPHSMLFIRRLNHVALADTKTEEIASYLATLCLRYQGHCYWLQSVLASAIVFLSRRLTGLSEVQSWSHPQITCSGYTLEQLQPCVCFVSDVLATTNRDARGNGDEVAMAYWIFGDEADVEGYRVSLDDCMKASFVEEYGALNETPLETIEN